MNSYSKIEHAIRYLQARGKEQASLAELAGELGLSPAHTQKLFRRWAGLSPKRFQQALTVEHAKLWLRQSHQAQLSISDELGLSSGSRLQALFVELEAMTPEQYRRMGQNLDLYWGRGETPYGDAFVCFSERGISQLLFEHDAERVELQLNRAWPRANLHRDHPAARRKISEVFDRLQANKSIHLQVQGTNFQVAVWRALLRLPKGALSTYAKIAQQAGYPEAVRAVGSAIGANPVAYVIPCHRVIRQSGALGGYRWSLERKQAILTQEYGRSHANTDAQ